MTDPSNMNLTPVPFALTLTSSLVTQPTTPVSRQVRIGRAPWAFLFGAGTLLFAGCGSTAPAPNSTNTPGTVLVNPATGTQFVVDANRGGQANRIKLMGAFWGRLVDVYDGNNNLQFESYLIGDNIASDLVNYRLDRNSVTEDETLTILHAAGTPEFKTKFEELDRNLQPLKKNGLTLAPQAVLTAMPRNATLVLSFDDLLDENVITAKNVVVLSGYPPNLPYEARVVADPSHGDLYDNDGDGIVEFHSTRVLIDMTVSQVEAQQANPPLPVNSLGLPKAQVTNQANVLVRIPTIAVPAIGQLTTLANLAGSGMDPNANSPLDTSSPTGDVVRSLRSSSGDLGDPNNGFLVDEIAPRVVGVQGITLQTVTHVAGKNYLIDAAFDAVSCAPPPRIGDVIRIGTAALAVVNQAGSAPTFGVITGVSVDLQVGVGPQDPNPTFLPGQAQYLMPFDPTMNVPPACFVRFSPNPVPVLLPSAGVAPNSSVTIRFSEPMDPATVSAFEAFTVTRVSNVQATIKLGNTIVGVVQPSLDLKEFTYTPQLPFERSPANFPLGEEYKLTLLGGANGSIDLSGKALADALPNFNFRLDPAAAEQKTRCLALRFNVSDEDANGAPELRGQFLFNLAKGTIRPRAVSRFSAVCDATQPVIGIQIPFTAPVQTPLSNLGSKMMTVWRYHDLGFALVDDSTLNLDVEGLAWAPFSGVTVDTYAKFQMAFSHSKFLPDEFVTSLLLPQWTNSGLVKTFASNVLDPTNDPLKVMHPKDRGYTVQPVDSFVSGTGTLMVPYPLNRGLPSTQFTRYTFRDTGLQAVGGALSGGVETDINGFALGITPVKLYAAGKVPTLGLPLLMEFRCYPSDQAFGLNGFKVNIALNSSARPAFRAFSTGGVLANGTVVKIDPDNNANALGGYTPAGAPTGFGSEIDPVVYLGQADFVVRVNRIHTVWIDTFQFQPQLQTPLFDPPNSLQPAGTQVLVALRGATGATNGTPPVGGVVPVRNAAAYDPYGDPRAAIAFPPPSTPFAITYPPLPGGGPDNTWKTNLALINNVPNIRLIQARITLISNPDTLLFPEITGMGFSFRY